MSDAEPHVSHWKQVARDLFFHEFAEPEDFYTKFGDAPSLYLEVAKRALLVEVEVSVAAGHSAADSALVDLAGNHTERTIDAAAYALMEQAFTTDVRNRNYDQLDSLVNIYDA